MQALRLPVDSTVIGALAVRHDVEAFALLVVGDAQAHDQVSDLERDEGDHWRPTPACSRVARRLLFLNGTRSVRRRGYCVFLVRL